MSLTVKDIGELDLPPGIRDRIASLNARIVAGSKEDVRSPQFKGLSDSEILAMFDRETRNLTALHPRLQEIEGKEASKFGSRSVARKWSERRPSVQDYWHDSSAELTVSQEEEADFWSIFLRPLVPHKRRLNPWSVLRTVDKMVLNTSSGLPYWMEKRQALAETLGNLTSILEREYPCLLFTRTQEGGKDRVAWGWGLADTIREQTFFRAMLDLLKLLPWRSALNGPDEVDIAVTRMFQGKGDRTLLSIDFSAYDQSLQPNILKPALYQLFRLFGDKWQDTVSTVVDRITSIGLITPDGIYTGEHGMSSGSSFTNEGDSWAQLLMALAYLMREADFSANDVQIQGDDGLYAVHAPEKLISMFESYGMEVNREKSDQSKEYAVFLQRFYHADYRFGRYLAGVYSATRALNRVVHLERWINLDDSRFAGEELSGRDYFSLRAISILENAKYHPWHRELVLLVARNDVDQLRFSSRGLRVFSSRFGNQEVSGTQHQLGQITPNTPLMEFATVKVLSKEVWGA